jgi:hypothetical protein
MEGEMKAEILHDTDFYAWTREQAAQLRRYKPNSVDWKHLAEEVEDLGSEQFNTVLSQLRNLLSHLLKAAYSTDENLIRHWKDEMIEFHASAIRRYTKAMRRRAEPQLGKEWRTARKRAASGLGRKVHEFPETCPFSLGELLDEDFDIEQAIQRIRSIDR